MQIERAAAMESRLPAISVAVMTLGFACLCCAFVWQPSLATFADDSVSYLVMAQVFSPWESASPAVAAAFAREAFYPPLFPLLLALAGAAHNLAWAHALTALLLAGWIPLAYVLGVRWLEDRRAAAAAALCVALLPALWVNAKGILSEPLFGLLLLATFCVIDRAGSERKRIWLPALLMTAMMLTRTAALGAIPAYALWALTRRDQTIFARVRGALPAVVAISAYGAWVLLRPAETADSYAQIVLDHGGGFLGAGSPVAAIGVSLLRQANAIGEGWVGSLLLFWVEGRQARPLLACAIGCLALGGMVMRLISGKPDAWMTAAYLATLLAWPFYDQMGRFLFPVLPALVLYAFWAAAAALRAIGRPAVLGHALIAVLVLSLTVPALAFMVQRAQMPGRYAEIVDWYRTPDLAEARARAQRHLDLFADMAEIGRLTRPEDRVMWVAPSYIALLAGRRGVAAPDSALAPPAYREAVRASGAEYVFLSLYHPRDTLRTLAWQAGNRALMDNAKVMNLRTQEGGSIVTSILLKVDR
jgi:hypothetical protein